MTIYYYDNNIYNNYIKLWDSYSRFWIKSYFDFFNGYTNWAKTVIDYSKNPSSTHSLGVINVVDDVEVISSIFSGDKQITVGLIYSGKENAPQITIKADAFKFEFQEFPSLYKNLMKNMLNIKFFDINSLFQDLEGYTTSNLFKGLTVSSGKSGLAAGWPSPATVIIDLTGNMILKDANLLTIRILK